MGSLWNRSGMVERYADDLRASGAIAYFFLGGTTTPLSVYQDSGESAAHPHPVVADANGRWPDVFVPYILSYDVQVKSADGVQLTYTLQVPNPDPIELTVTVGVEEKVQTGMIHAEMVNGVRSGYVRLNGRTIGNGSSTGSERANPDTEDLFTYLWNSLVNAIAPVSGGRGGTAAADYAANKTITLPNWQGAGPVGLDDMGATAGGFFSGLTFGAGDDITAGSSTGSNTLTLVTGNIPAHTHTGTTSNEGAHTHTGTTGAESVPHTHSGTTVGGSAHAHAAFIRDPTHVHTWSNSATTIVTITGAGGSLSAVGTVDQGATMVAASTGVHVNSVNGGGSGTDDATASESAHTHGFTSGDPSVTHTHSFTTGAGSAHSHTFTTSSIGSSTPFNNLSRSVLVTWFIKL